MSVTEEARSIIQTKDTLFSSKVTSPEGSSDYVTRLGSVVDLTDTVDTERKVRQLPAVTHELVRPTEHHITHEQITREIHHHDVFHRILPVIDLEILPTKHYIVDPERPGILKEISEAEAPVKNNWSITPNFTLSTEESCATNESRNHTLSSLRHCHAVDQPEPILTSKKSYMTKDGFMRTEYVWRHAPTFDMSAYNQGKTIPLRMNCMSPADFSRYLAAQPRHTHSSATENLHNTTQGDLQQIEELQRQAQLSLNRHAIIPQNPASCGAATEPTGTQTQPTKGLHQSSESRTKVAEEALVAAENAIAVAEEVIANAQATSYTGGRSSWAGTPGVKDEVESKKVSYKQTRGSWAGDAYRDGNTRGKMRARLHKAKQSVIEVGLRLRRQ